VQRWHNQTVNNFNKGAARLDRFVWMPTRVPHTHGGFRHATPATWDAAWRELVREREAAEEQEEDGDPEE
jgi:hypothetical protein